MAEVHQVLNGFSTSLKNAVEAGTGRVDVSLSSIPDSRLASSESQHGLLIVRDQVSGAYKEILYDWSGRVGDKLLQCKRITGVYLAAGDIIGSGICEMTIDQIKAAIDKVRDDSATALAAQGEQFAFALDEVESDLTEAIAAVEGTVGNFLDRTRQTRLDVSGTTLKVLPPDIFDEANGDTLPPLRPDGSYGYNQALTPFAPSVDFTLNDGKIAGNAAVAPWAADLVSKNAEALLMLQRSADGSYQLKKGAENLTTTAVVCAPGTKHGYNDSHYVFGKRLQNEMAVAGIISGLTNTKLFTGTGVTMKARAVFMNGDHEPPLLTDILAVGGWVEGLTGGDISVNLPLTVAQSVAAGARCRLAVECVKTAGGNAMQGMLCDTADSISVTDAAKFSVVATDNTYKAEADNVVDAANALYNLAATINYYTDTVLTRPDADEGAEVTALIGSESYPYKQGSTTTLVHRLYSEVSDDTYASNPTSVQCPVCMLPPPKMAS